MNSILKITTSFLLLLFMIACNSSNKSPDKEKDIRIWLTKGDESVKLQQVDYAAITDIKADTIHINIDGSQKYQKMIGFGGAICDNSAYVFDTYLDKKETKKIFEELFGQDGIRLNYMRMIMGSTDNSFDWYTYDDMPEGEIDMEMEHFSMKKDETDVIPYYQLAQSINPDLMILGSPCSPPAWMKNSKHLFHGGVEPQYYPALAKYFVKYIQTMKQKYGLPVEAITIQNEPLFEQYVPNPSYPNMLMTAKEQGEFIKTALGPEFERNGIKSKIITFDHNWDLYDYGLSLLDDPEVKKYIAGTGFHCYGGGPELMKNVWVKHPDKEIYHTECSGGGWGPSDFPNIMEWLVGQILIGNIENYTSTVLLWYLSTDEGAGPITNGCPSCRPFVTVNSKTGSISYNPEYYLTGHFSKFIDRGAYRIKSSDTSSEGIRNIAFENPDGLKVLVVLNTLTEERQIQIKDGKDTFLYIQPAQSTATYIW